MSVPLPVYLDHNATTPVAPEVAAAMRPDTALVSIMHANNEIGTLQPVAQIAALTRPRGVLLHTDAAQSVGKVAVDVDGLGVDLLTLAGRAQGLAPPPAAALRTRLVGSACHARHDAVSGVLAALGLDAARAMGAVRLSTGWPTTMQEIERAADALIAAWRSLART